MQKDFDAWNSEKKKIQETDLVRFYKVRDIWWCKIGVNVGFEQDGKNEGFGRPILILKGFSKNTVLCAPLTTSSHGNQYRIPIGMIDGKPASVILSQIKVIDIKRLTTKIAVLDKETFQKIQKSLQNWFEAIL